MFLSQYSSCPPVISAVSANDSQEGCDFHHCDEILTLFAPCLKGRSLWVLSHCPSTPVKKLARSGYHEQVQLEINTACAITALTGLSSSYITLP